ncbi:MAG TPA: nitronate monooxygenase, partial [Actinomycetes bacterium]|nr:nitronate monooxygenase [Actinomycetes bacterium]
MTDAAQARLADRLGLQVPVVAAPMAGGTSTVELVVAVCEAGGAAFLPAGYLSIPTLQARIQEIRSKTSRPFGVNVMVPSQPLEDRSAVAAYGAALAETAGRLGAGLGEPSWTDDDYAAKLDALTADPVPVVSFTFGCPRAEDVARLQRAGSLVLVTVTSPVEATLARRVGADGLVAQGTEAGGHSACFHDDP